MGAHRAEIEWLDPGKTGGCLRIGCADFSWERYDDYHQACSIKREGNLAAVKGWHHPITVEDWLAMEACFKREGFAGYVFEKKTRTGKIHRHVTVFNDPAKPNPCPRSRTGRSGVSVMPKRVKVTIEVDGGAHSVTSQEFNVPDSHGVRLVQNAVAGALNSLGDVKQPVEQTEPAKA